MDPLTAVHQFIFGQTQAEAKQPEPLKQETASGSTEPTTSTEVLSQVEQEPTQDTTSNDTLVIQLSTPASQLLEQALQKTEEKTVVQESSKEPLNPAHVDTTEELQITHVVEAPRKSTEELQITHVVEAPRKSEETTRSDEVFAKLLAEVEKAPSESKKEQPVKAVENKNTKKEPSHKTGKSKHHKHHKHHHHHKHHSKT